MISGYNWSPRSRWTWGKARPERWTGTWWNSGSTRKRWNSGMWNHSFLQFLHLYAFLSDFKCYLFALVFSKKGICSQSIFSPNRLRQNIFCQLEHFLSNCMFPTGGFSPKLQFPQNYLSPSISVQFISPNFIWQFLQITRQILYYWNVLNCFKLHIIVQITYFHDQFSPVNFTMIYCNLL